jgi:hypothetical protein
MIARLPARTLRRLVLAVLTGAAVGVTVATVMWSVPMWLRFAGIALALAVVATSTVETRQR